MDSRKKALIAALRQFIAQRPGIDPRKTPSPIARVLRAFGV